MKNLSARQVDYSVFQELGVQVLGIAAEHSFSQIPFADSLHLPYPLLSDYPALRLFSATRASSRIPVSHTVWRHGGRLFS